MNMKTMKITLAIVLFLILGLSGVVHSSYQRLPVPEGTTGPESVAFDNNNRGPYTGISDGRVMKWDSRRHAWTQFSVPSNRRPEDCNGSQDPSREEICGRPLGLQFNQATGDLYIADSSYGLLRVGPKGGAATLLSNIAGGTKLTFTNGLDINQENGMVYFVDSSSRFTRRDHDEVVSSGDSTGRLLRYDPNSNSVTVLTSNIIYPNGVALSKDYKFLLFTETTTGRIVRYWLQGPKAGKSEDFATVPGYPDNIRRNSRGEFWVALASSTARVGDFSASYSRFQRLNPSDMVAGVLLTEDGQVVEVLGSDGGALGPISEVHENNEALWIGSVEVPYVSTYSSDN